MKIVKYENSEKFVRGSECIVWEYPLNDKDINCAISEINGRYPSEGYCYNKECKELVYVISGSGTLYLKDKKEVNFKEKDVLLIDKNEPYYWEANCQIIMPCIPAWTIEQYDVCE